MLRTSKSARASRHRSRTFQMIPEAPATLQQGSGTSHFSPYTWARPSRSPESSIQAQAGRRSRTQHRCSPLIRTTPFQKATPVSLPIVDPEEDVWTVRIGSGVLPAGVTMNDQGEFSGTATETGTFNLTMKTCDDRTPPACSTFTYTLTVEPSLPATGIETLHIGLAGLIALLLGSLVLVITSRRRTEGVQVAKR
jgi:LPXTG-motif cell wall-anchored protein